MLALRRRDHQAEPPFMRNIVVFVLVKTLLLFVNEVAAAAAAAVTTSTYNNTMGFAIFSQTAAPHLATSKFSHCRVLRFFEQISDAEQAQRFVQKYAKGRLEGC